MIWKIRKCKMSFPAYFSIIFLHVPFQLHRWDSRKHRSFQVDSLLKLVDPFPVAWTWPHSRPLQIVPRKGPTSQEVEVSVIWQTISPTSKWANHSFEGFFVKFIIRLFKDCFEKQRIFGQPLHWLHQEIHQSQSFAVFVILTPLKREN